MYTLRRTRVTFKKNSPRNMFVSPARAFCRYSVIIYEPAKKAHDTHIPEMSKNYDQIEKKPHRETIADPPLTFLNRRI